MRLGPTRNRDGGLQDVAVVARWALPAKALRTWSYRNHQRLPLRVAGRRSATINCPTRALLRPMRTPAEQTVIQECPP